MNPVNTPSLPFSPRGMWVVVDRDPEKEETKGKLIVPHAYRVKTNRGTVIGLGCGFQNDYGVMRKIEGIKLGDIIQWQDTETRVVEVRDVEYTFVGAGAIILIENRQCPDELLELCK